MLSEDVLVQDRAAQFEDGVRDVASRVGQADKPTLDIGGKGQTPKQGRALFGEPDSAGSGPTLAPLSELADSGGEAKIRTCRAGGELGALCVLGACWT
jgi:hypothetical protein